MSNIKISEMPQATSIGGDDIIPIVQDGVNKQTTKKTLNTYSTTEQVVGTWIDGKPLYKVTIQDTVPTTTTGTFATKTVDLASYNIDFLNLENTVMVVSGGDVTNYAILPYLENDGNQVKIFADISTTSKELKIRSSAGYRSGASLYITMQYTKTTD